MQMLQKGDPRLDGAPVYTSEDVLVGICMTREWCNGQLLVLPIYAVTDVQCTESFVTFGQEADRNAELGVFQNKNVRDVFKHTHVRVPAVECLGALFVQEKTQVRMIRMYQDTFEVIRPSKSPYVRKVNYKNVQSVQDMIDITRYGEVDDYIIEWEDGTTEVMALTTNFYREHGDYEHEYAKSWWNVDTSKQSDVAFQFIKTVPEHEICMDFSNTDCPI
jgi:sporulation protein YlmC with PRC-barrel domain